MRIIAVVLAGLMLVLGPSKGANIGLDFKEDDYRLIMRLEGDIEPGDLAMLQKQSATYFLYLELERKEPGRYKMVDESKLEEWQAKWSPPTSPPPTRAELPDTHPVRLNKDSPYHILYLNSLGGDVLEAMAIGEWVREKRLFVIVTPDAVCASACVFVLAAGLDKAVSGDVGIHRPYFSSMPAGDIGEAMRGVLAQARDYFERMNIPPQLADDMFSVPPERSRLLSTAALEQYRLDSLDIAAAERHELLAAQALGIDRGELMRRTIAFEASPELEKCNAIPSNQPFAGCYYDAKRLYGLVK